MKIIIVHYFVAKFINYFKTNSFIQFEIDNFIIINRKEGDDVKIKINSIINFRNIKIVLFIIISKFSLKMIDFFF